MKCLSAVILFLLLSCAPKLAPQVAVFEKQQPTLSSWPDLHYETLVFDEEKKVIIDETSPVYLFASGKSHVQAFALPDKRPLEIKIKSYLIGDTVHDSFVFIPDVLLLDENFNVITKIDQSVTKIERIPHLETPYVAYANTLVFTVWADYPVRYFVVYTTDEQLKKVSAITMMAYSQIIMPGYVGAYPIGKERIEIPHGPVGRLKISVKELK